MKKIIIAFSTLLILSSCKKEYTCECLTETGNLVGEHKIKAKKKETDEKCNPTKFGYSERLISCKIK
jgi:hypothetical protein